MGRKRSPPSASSSSTTTSSSSTSGSSSSNSRSSPSSTSSWSSPRSSSPEKRSRSPSSSSSSLRSRSSDGKRNSRRAQKTRPPKSRRYPDERRQFERRRSRSPRSSPPRHDVRRSGRSAHAFEDNRRGGGGGGRKRSPDERDKNRGSFGRQNSEDREGRARQGRRSSRDRNLRSRNDGKFNGERGRADRTGDDRTHTRRGNPSRNREEGNRNDGDGRRKDVAKSREKEMERSDCGRVRHEVGEGKNSDHGGKRRSREVSFKLEREENDPKRRRTNDETPRNRRGASNDVTDAPGGADGDVAGNERKRGRDSRRSREEAVHGTKERDAEKSDALESSRWGAKQNRKQEESKPVEDAGPNFGLSGKLAEESRKVKGVVMKFTEPPEARKPDLRWRLYIFKGGEVVGEPIPIHRQSYYLFGRDRTVTDIPTDHPSCSKQHSVLQFRCVEVESAEGLTTEAIKPYLMDLESVNGTFINRERVEAHRYYELMEQDTVRFGLSSREYVLLHEGSVG
ncbi:hypothetical protein BSKO_04121 [Bryopsis sp. KO-2023]|nr:hypothetical protein BSKO_04121 [Bryopsis sp. KO-2023]